MLLFVTLLFKDGIARVFRNIGKINLLDVLDREALGLAPLCAGMPAKAESKCRLRSQL
jgi:hypothetical protein